MRTLICLGFQLQTHSRSQPWDGFYLEMLNHCGWLAILREGMTPETCFANPILVGSWLHVQGDRNAYGNYIMMSEIAQVGSIHCSSKKILVSSLSPDVHPKNVPPSHEQWEIAGVLPAPRNGKEVEGKPMNVMLSERRRRGFWDWGIQNLWFLEWMISDTTISGNPPIQANRYV